MKLPNGERAIVGIRKLQGYCLNPHHARGRNKARVFASVGIGQADAELLRNALFAAASNAEAGQVLRTHTAGATLLWTSISFTMPETVRVRSTWIVRIGEDLAAADELFCTIEEEELGMADIEMLSVVALLEDLPGEGLVRGQVGTVVEKWAPGVYEVEFCDDSGSTYAMVALKAGQVMQLHHEATHQAA